MNHYRNELLIERFRYHGEGISDQCRLCGCQIEDLENKS